MAIATAFVAVNMSAQVWSGAVTEATLTKITVTDGLHTANYLGNFFYDGRGAAHGTVTEFQELLGSTLAVSVSDITVDAFLVYTNAQANQLQSVFPTMFAGNDSLTGSSFSDALIGFDGDDVLRGAGGNDLLDGGAGVNTAAYNGESKNFTIESQNGTVTVKDRGGTEGTDTLVNIHSLSFGGQDGGIDPTWLGKASLLDGPRFADLVSLYIAYFDRAPDALGLQYWASRVVDGMSLVDIAKSFFVQPETIATYPPGMSTTAFVTQVYQNVLGRAPDAPGLAYWVNDLNTGAETQDMFMLAMIYGAQAPTGSPIDAQYLANKQAVGGHFALHMGLGDVTWAHQVMNLVDENAVSVTAANALTDAFASAAVADDPHLLLPIVGVGY